jgi:hypothetical protein
MRKEDREALEHLAASMAASRHQHADLDPRVLIRWLRSYADALEEALK